MIDDNFFEKGSITVQLTPFGNGICVGKPTADQFNAGVHTSSTNNAGTDSDVYIKLISTDGIASPTIRFDRPGNKWQAGETNLDNLDTLQALSNIETVLLFKITENAWLPDEIEITPGRFITLIDGVLMKTSRGSNTTWLNAKDKDELRNLVELKMAFVDSQLLSSESIGSKHAKKRSPAGVL